MDVTETGATWTGPLPAPDPDAPAYFQYTLGSTGTSAGAVVTHGNLTVSAAHCMDGHGHHPDGADRLRPAPLTLAAPAGAAPRVRQRGTRLRVRPVRPAEPPGHLTLVSVASASSSTARNRCGRTMRAFSAAFAPHAVKPSYGLAEAARRRGCGRSGRCGVGDGETSTCRPDRGVAGAWTRRLRRLLPWPGAAPYGRLAAHR
ncbi:AMP-binding protein [Streptomyces niveiscabiei]|uniref:AMP-binding protein n=1 Tax=Streptomyces niveiscabiei TaxID=164115 RepID=A0ABW9HNC3_9ACTN